MDLLLRIRIRGAPDGALTGLHAVAVIATLALGIGANTAVFSW